MDWDRVIQFIEDRETGFRAGLRGASVGQLEALEVLNQAPLPAVYAEFLDHLGGEGDFELSWEHHCSAASLLEVWNPSPGEVPQLPYPVGDFIWIGGQLDELDETYWGDLYLDMRGGDRDDPPVIADHFEDRYDPHAARHLVAPRFSEYVQIQAFRSYEGERRSCKLALRSALGPEDGRREEVADARWSAILRVLVLAGLEAALPGGPNLWVGSRAQDLALRLERLPHSIMAYIVGSDRIALSQLAEVIEDGAPGPYTRHWMKGETSTT